MSKLNEKGFPRLPHKKLAAAEPYRAPGAQPGHEGRKPKKVKISTTRFASMKDPPTERNANHCTLCWLEHRGHLRNRNEIGGKWRGDIRFKAGERLQDDFSKSGVPLIAGSLGAFDRVNTSGAGADISALRIDADAAVNRALYAVGDASAFLLREIVLAGHSLSDIAKRMQVNKLAVLPALLVALDGLVRHYGMDREPIRTVRGGEAQPIHPYASESETKKIA